MKRKESIKALMINVSVFVAICTLLTAYLICITADIALFMRLMGASGALVAGIIGIVWLWSGYKRGVAIGGCNFVKKGILGHIRAY